MAIVGNTLEVQITGTQQSPIEIDHAQTFRLAVPDNYLDLSGYAKPLAGHFSGDNFVLDEFAVITAGGSPWVLRKIHIHCGAEHRIAGHAQSQYEVHLLHTAGSAATDDLNISGPKLVIGAFFKLDTKAPSKSSLKGLNDALAAKGGRGKKGQPFLAIDPRDFLPPWCEWPKWYRYEGSLTTKPFSEDVSWFVLATEFAIRKSEFDKIAEDADQHTREVYPLNRRFVLRGFD